MQLSTIGTDSFIAQLGSASPVPGGGSAAALIGAQGVALITMVANLTIGKPKYAEFEELNRLALKKGNKLCAQLVTLIDRDANAFDKVSKAYKLPKETDEDKKTRSIAISQATLAATETPYEVMEVSSEALNLCKSLINKSNPNVSSDLGVSALSLLAAIKSAWLNVLINLNSIDDPEKAAYYKSSTEEILAKAKEDADYVFNSVKDSLTNYK